MRSDTEPGSQGVSYSAIRLQSNDGTEIDFDKVPIPVGEDLDHIFIVIVMLFYRSSFWKSHTLEDLDSLEDLFTIIVMLFYRNSSLTGTNNSRQQPTKAYERLTRLMWRKLSGQDHYHVPDHRLVLYPEPTE